MSSFLNTNATVTHRTPIPASISRIQAVKALHDHEANIKCDPHMVHYERILEPSHQPLVPDDVKATGPPEVFSVTDRVAALPKGIWDTDVVGVYEFTRTADGTFVRLHAALGLRMDTRWTVVGEDGALDLLEEVTMYVSRMLVGIVKAQCESNWNKIHGSMLKVMEVQ